MVKTGPLKRLHFPGFFVLWTPPPLLFPCSPFDPIIQTYCSNHLHKWLMKDNPFRDNKKAFSFFKSIKLKFLSIPQNSFVFFCVVTWPVKRIEQK